MADCVGAAKTVHGLLPEALGSIMVQRNENEYIGGEEGEITVPCGGTPRLTILDLRIP